MPRRHALLDFSSVSQETKQTLDTCLLQMQYNSTDHTFLNEGKWTREIDAWLKSLPVYSSMKFKGEYYSWVDKLLNRVSMLDWKLSLVYDAIHSINQGSRWGLHLVHSLIFFDKDEQTRQAVLNIHDARVVVCASLQEVIDMVKIPPEKLGRHCDIEEKFVPQIRNPFHR